MDKIEGKVARIVTPRELVINRGEEHSVVVGMKFAVLTEKGLEVTDPDTGEVLEELPAPKVLVRVTRVHPRVAVASTFRTYKTQGGALWGVNTIGGIGSLTSPPQTVTETLGPAPSLPEFDQTVRIGDRVIQTDGEEFQGWRVKHG